MMLFLLRVFKPKFHGSESFHHVVDPVAFIYLTLMNPNAISISKTLEKAAREN